MLTEQLTERKSQPQLKKKGTALLAGYFGLLEMKQFAFGYAVIQELGCLFFTMTVRIR
jgi:hypothetical protein